MELNAKARLQAATTLIQFLARAFMSKAGLDGRVVRTGDDEAVIKLSSPLTKAQVAAIQAIPHKGKKFYPDKEGFKGNYITFENPIKEGVTGMPIDAH